MNRMVERRRRDVQRKRMHCVGRSPHPRLQATPFDVLGEDAIISGCIRTGSPVADPADQVFFEYAKGHLGRTSDLLQDIKGLIRHRNDLQDDFVVPDHIVIEIVVGVVFRYLLHTGSPFWVFMDLHIAGIRGLEPLLLECMRIMRRATVVTLKSFFTGGA